MTAQDRLAGRTVLVTGGARRLGGEISRHLGRQGARVLVHHRSSGSEAAALLAELPEGSRALRQDLMEADGPADLVEAAFTGPHPPDSLVHAAASFLHRPALDTTVEEWDRVLALNLRAFHFLVREFALRRGTEGGSIVAISDVAAVELWTGYLAHSVSKAALLADARGWARVLGPRFRVNTVVPGTVLPPEDTPPEERERLARKTLLQRLGDPEDVTRAVSYLLTARFTTGTELYVTGGSELWRGSGD